MRKTFLLKVTTLVVTAFSLIAVSSCVDKKYTLSMDTLDLKVQLFQEGVCLPLGATDTMSLARLIQKLELPEEFKEFFQAGEDGSYSLTYGPETMDMSENLSSLSGAVDIDKIDFSKSVDFKLEGVEVDEISYEGDSYGFEKDMSSELQGLDVTIPKVDSPFSIDANLRGFNLGDVEWEIEVGNQGSDPNFAFLPEVLNVPSAVLTNPAVKDLEMSIH